MGSIKEMLQGKKTYIVAVIGVLVNGLFAMGYIDEESIKVIDGILVFIGLGTVRAGIKSGQ